MSTVIFELSEEEIQAISGGTLIDPPAAAQSSYTEGVDIPEVDNNPPG